MQQAVGNQIIPPRAQGPTQSLVPPLVHPPVGAACDLLLRLPLLNLLLLFCWCIAVVTLLPAVPSPAAGGV